MDLKDNEGNTPINLCTKREILHLFSNQVSFLFKSRLINSDVMLLWFIVV